MNDKTARLNYDDLPDDMIRKINELLKDYNIKLEFDHEFHDGFEILSVVSL